MTINTDYETPTDRLIHRDCGGRVRRHDKKWDPEARQFVDARLIHACDWDGKRVAVKEIIDAGNIYDGYYPTS